MGWENGERDEVTASSEKAETISRLTGNNPVRRLLSRARDPNVER